MYYTSAPDFYINNVPLGSNKLEKAAVDVLQRVDPNLPGQPAIKVGTMLAEDKGKALYFIRYAQNVSIPGQHGPLVSFVGLVTTPEDSYAHLFSADGDYEDTLLGPRKKCGEEMLKNSRWREKMKDALRQCIAQFRLNDPKMLEHAFQANSERLRIGHFQ